MARLRGEPRQSREKAVRAMREQQEHLLTIRPPSARAVPSGRRLSVLKPRYNSGETNGRSPRNLRGMDRSPCPAQSPHGSGCAALRSHHRSRSGSARTGGTPSSCPTSDAAMEWAVNLFIRVLIRSGILTEDLDYHVIRASMVIIFVFFGYQKWFQYEAQVLIPYISNGPLIFWLYPVFGVRGASWFLGCAEWFFGALLFLGFWNRRLGILGAVGSCFTFIATATIIPFMPDGWAASAGGFPAMAGNVAFLMKDLVLFAASFYLLRQDVARVAHAIPASRAGFRRSWLMD